MEIGSIYEINPKDLYSYNDRDIEFPFMAEKGWNMQFFNTGRSAIESYFNTNEEIHRVWCPSFICSSVVDALIRAGKEIMYYPIDRRLHMDIKFLHQIDIREGDAFYLVQYFGISEPFNTIKTIEDFRGKGVLIFEDITMCLLSDKDSDFAYGDIVIGSVRKWCGIPDGAFIASKNRLPVIKREKAAYDYTLYYFTAQILKSLYLSDPEKYEKREFLSFSELGIRSLFSDYTIREMSEISYRLLRSIKWGGVLLKAT